MATTIDQIPQASQLQIQLATLNNAIAILNAGGAVNSLTISQTAGGAGMGMSTVVPLNPPITNPSTLTDLATGLQQQADAVTQQLIELGYDQPPVRKPLV